MSRVSVYEMYGSTYSSRSTTSASSPSAVSIGPKSPRDYSDAANSTRAEETTDQKMNADDDGYSSFDASSDELTLRAFLQSLATKSLSWNWFTSLGVVWGFLVALGPGALQQLLLTYGVSTALSLKGDLYNTLAIRTTTAVYVLVYMLYPLAGLLGDVYCGRFRTIAVSIAVMSGGLLLTSIAILMGPGNNDNRPAAIFHVSPAVCYVIETVIVLLVCSGLAGFQANVLQFAVDQVQDHASSREVSSLIRTFTWASFLGLQITESIAITTAMCGSLQNLSYDLRIFVASLFGALSLIYVVLLLVSKLLIESRPGGLRAQPRSQNPYKMVCAVLRFARKHSHPLRRSSLLYWSDESASRIDFAKEKYGGPFSSEEVEDVKTFFRMLLIIVAMGTFYLVAVSSVHSLPALAIHLQPSDILNCSNNASDSRCSFQNPLVVLQLTTIACVICSSIAYEVVIHPLVGTHSPNLLKSFGIGLLLMVASVLYTLVVDSVGHAMHKRDDAVCMFTYKDPCNTEYTPLHINVLILLVPKLLNVLCRVIVFNSGLQFIVAQAPHAMKGMLIGLFYFTNGPYTFLGTLLVLPFSYPFKAHPSTYPSCGFGYYLTNSVLAILGLAVYSLAARTYKYRRRGQC